MVTARTEELYLDRSPSEPGARFEDDTPSGDSAVPPIVSARNGLSISIWAPDGMLIPPTITSMDAAPTGAAAVTKDIGCCQPPATAPVVLDQPRDTPARSTHSTQMPQLNPRAVTRYREETT